MKTIRFIALLMTISILFFSCKKDNNISKDETLEWNKKIAIAYVHSYAISIGEAILEMQDDSIKIKYIRRAIDPI
ncbi:MAG: hypothetical protein Q8K92_20145, partial [Leadbetterella sp.]|nr:hypothetical protein [Leadbetterella sp.]